MKYLLKQKFNINELINIPKNQKRVLLIINEDFLRDIYHKHLSENDFEVYISNFSDRPAITRHLNFSDILILDLLNTEMEDKLEFLKVILKDFPKIAVITIGLGLNEKLLKSLMDLGISGHLNREFSRPIDLVDIVKMASKI